MTPRQVGYCLLVLLLALGLWPVILAIPAILKLSDKSNTPLDTIKK